jgi:AraC-like DNA-binding protein
MFARDYLNLRLVQVKSPDGWGVAKEGFSFVFLKRGSGKFLAGAREHRVGPGDVLVAGADPRAKICAANGEELAFWAFALCVEHLYPLFAGDEISLLHSVVEGFNGLKLYPAASPLAKQCQNFIADVPPQFDLDHRSHLLRVAATILSAEFKTAQHSRIGFVRIEDHLVQVFEKLSSDELLTSSVGELAAKFSCSRRHLNRLFHRYFGFSVAALRMEMRLLKAVSLLRDPDSKVITVAEQCGFNHLGLFNTCFKKRFGASPGQWRKGAQRPEVPAGLPPNKNSQCPLRPKGLCPWTAAPELSATPALNLSQQAAASLLRGSAGPVAENADFEIQAVAGNKTHAAARSPIL